MTAPSHSTPRINATPRGDNNPRGPAIAGAVVGWMLVLSALAATVWARFQPAEWSAGKAVLAVVILVAMGLGVAMAGKEVR